MVESTLDMNNTNRKLYNLIADRLEEQGERMPCTLESLYVYAEEPRADIDYLKIINLDNQSFFDACYVLAFNTYPPAHYNEHWKEDIENLSREEFQRKFINSFVCLRDFGTKHIRLRNCIYLEEQKNKQYEQEKSELTTRIKIKDWIYKTFKPIYTKMPALVKRMLKSIYSKV